jgi:energy-coupling factor transporter ATP-binding protein EcfA2
MANVLQSGIASAERVFELLAEEQSPRRARRRIRWSTSAASAGSSSTTCRSPTARHPLIEDLSLVAEPGETVAIVGPTGAGKTTLVNLIMRFYELDGGAIRLDGLDIATCRARAALQHRHGAAGHVAVRRHHPREHRLRQPRRHRGADPRGGQGHLRRPLRALAARRLRHRGRRRGRQRSAPARSSCSPSPGRSSPTRRSSSSTRPPARSTPAPRCSSSTPWPRCAPTAPAS